MMNVVSKRNSFYEKIYVEMGFTATCSRDNKLLIRLLEDLYPNPIFRRLFL
jgi:hypothetical protein